MESNKIRQLEQHNIYRELVSAVIEHVCLSISIDSLDLVTKKLKENHNVSLDEILNHPEHLKSVLINLYGDSYDSILNKIKSVFGTSISQNSISDFVSRLER